MVMAAVTIDGNLTPDGTWPRDDLLPYGCTASSGKYPRWPPATIYGNKPSGVKLPSMVAAAVTIEGPCPDW